MKTRIISLVICWIVIIGCMGYLYSSNDKRIRESCRNGSEPSYLRHIATSIYEFIEKEDRFPHDFSEIKIDLREVSDRFCWERAREWEKLLMKEGLKDADRNNIVLVRQLRPRAGSLDQITLYGVSTDSDIRNILRWPNITEPAILEPIKKEGQLQ